jgi:N6-adenosine-specific RNA methylase IME4
VVATNTRTKVRFGAVTHRPGGWTIGGQICGVDAETAAVRKKMADKIMANHKKELVG